MKVVRYHISTFTVIAYIIASVAGHIAMGPSDDETRTLKFITISGTPVQLLDDKEAAALIGKSGFIRSEKVLRLQFNLFLGAYERNDHEIFTYCAAEAARIAHLFETEFQSRYYSLLIADLLDDEEKLSTYVKVWRRIIQCHLRIFQKYERDAEVEAILEEGITELENAGCGQWTGKALETLADYYFTTGRGDEGLHCLEEALEACRKTDHLPIVSHLSGRIGAYHVRMGNHETANTAYRLCISSAERLGDPYYLSRALSFLGCLRATEGFIVEAESLLVQACRYSDLACDPNSAISRHLLLAQVLNGIGESDHAAGIAEKSIFLAEELLNGTSPESSIYASGTTKHCLASGLALTSRIQRTKGNLDGAISNMEKALAIAERGIDRHFIAGLEKQLGDTYAAAGKEEKAHACYNRALSISRMLSENRRVAEYTTAMARLHLEHRRYRQAEELLETAVRLAIEENYWMQQIESCRLLGKTKIMRGKREEGRQLLVGAIDLFEEKSKLKPHLENRHFLSELIDSIYDDLICLESETSHRADSLILWIERSRHAEPYCRSIASTVLDDSIRSCIAHREWIPEDALIIQPTITPDRLILVALNRHGATYRCIDVESATLERDVYAFIEQCRPTGVDPHSGHAARRGHRVADITSRLYGILIEPLAPLVESAETLCFIPDGILRFLPFGALKDRGMDRFLLEIKTTFVAPSLFDLRRGMTDGASGPHFAEPLLIGEAIIPDLARMIYPHLDTLPHAERELTTVRHFFTDCTVLKGSRATRKAVLACIERADLIHISSHSINYPLHSGKTALLLSPSEKITSERELSGALLDEEEISNLDLSRARLIILAACESVWGSVCPNNRGSGMAEAFVRAGAHTVIGSLWPIEDAAAERILTSFYKNMSIGDTSPLEAIHSVQREIIANSRIAGNCFDNMQVWAPIAYCGSFDNRIGHADTRLSLSDTTEVK